MSDRPGFDHEDGSCLACDGHAVTRANAATKRTFYGCSNWPKCTNVAAIRTRRGDFYLSADDLDRAYYDAFYEGDG